MDIFNNKNRKIRCINNKDGEFFGCDGNHHLLEVGREYTLDDTYVHGWYTVVWLEEFPGVAFNSCAFEELEEND